MSTSDFFRFLFAVYPIDAELTIEIRPLLPKWQKTTMREDDIRAIHASVRRWYTLTPEYLYNAAKYADGYKDTFDVYFGVLPRVERQGGQSGVWGASVLYADIDGGNEGIFGSVQRVKDSALPLPHIAVQSGGGVHCYWLLSEPVPFPDYAARIQFKELLQRLVSRIGGESPAAHADPSAAECARILRVPNTWNHKREDEPRATAVIRFAPDEPRHSADWWGANLPSLKISVVAKKYPASPGQMSDGLLRWAREGYPEGKRHQDLIGAAAWLVRDCGLPPEEASALLRLKAHHSPGIRRITDTELDDMIRWASR